MIVMLIQCMIKLNNLLFSKNNNTEIDTILECKSTCIDNED